MKRLRKTLLISIFFSISFLTTSTLLAQNKNTEELKLSIRLRLLGEMFTDKSLRYVKNISSPSEL